MRFRRGGNRLRRADTLWRGLIPDWDFLEEDWATAGGIKGAKFEHRTATIKEIRASDEKARIVVLTTFDADEDIYRAIQAGAKGYLLKDCSTSDLLAAIRKIHAGGTHVSERAASRLAERAMAGGGLSPREIEVLKWIAAGKSRPWIVETPCRAWVGKAISKRRRARCIDAPL